VEGARYTQLRLSFWVSSILWVGRLGEFVLKKHQAPLKASRRGEADFQLTRAGALLPQHIPHRGRVLCRASRVSLLCVPALLCRSRASLAFKYDVELTSTSTRSKEYDQLRGVRSC